MKHHRTAVFICGLAILLGSTVADARDGARNEVPEGGAWERYETPPEGRYKDPSYYLLQGRRRADGACAMKGTQTAGPAHPRVGIEELAFNSDTCQSWVIEGDLAKRGSKNRSDARGTGGYSGASEEEQMAIREGEIVAAGSGCDHPDVFCGTQSHPNGGSGYREARGRSWFEDPPGFDVTRVYTTARWWPDNGCAAAHESNLKHYWFWLRETGWYRHSKASDAGANCNRVVGHTRGGFNNNPFCGNAPDTYNNYQNWIRGLTGGRAEHEWIAVKSGGCENMLSFRHELDWDG